MRTEILPFAKLSLAGLLLISVTACPDDGPVTSTSTDEGSVPPGELCAPVSDWSLTDVNFENELVDKINAKRNSARLCGDLTFEQPDAPLVRDASLNCAARLQVGELLAGNTYPGDSSQGDPAERTEAAGYVANATVGESSAVSKVPADDLVDLWFRTPESCAVLMDPAGTEIGMGVGVGSLPGVSGGLYNDFQMVWFFIGEGA